MQWWAVRAGQCGNPCEGSSGADAADAPAAQTQQTCWGLSAAGAVRQGQTWTAGARQDGTPARTHVGRGSSTADAGAVSGQGAVCETASARGRLRDKADAQSGLGGGRRGSGGFPGEGQCEDVAQMTHHRAERRHGLRGAEAASAALAELRRAGERYGYTGSRLSRRCGESSSALRFVPLLSSTVGGCPGAVVVSNSTYIYIHRAFGDGPFVPAGQPLRWGQCELE